MERRQESDEPTETQQLTRERGTFFNDPNAVFRKDRVVTGEQRWHAIGTATGVVLLVVHVYRMENEHDKEETIRIVSAREANKRERGIYFQQAGE